MTDSGPILVCFAVKQEARAFQRSAGAQPRLRVLLTGIGKRNAERTIRACLSRERPALVLTCGFAGGLGPELKTGAVVFDAEPKTRLEAQLVAAGARRGRFHCADRVATLASEKRALHETTGADAVEMESGVIREVCRGQGIVGATVRVVLDTAQEDLPLDFNGLLTDDDELDGRKLALALVKSPGKLGALMRLQKQSRLAAERLGEVLTRVLGAIAEDESGGPG